MKKQAALYITLIFILSNCSNISFFGQEPPTNVPKLFAPDIISKPDRYEFGCTLSKDGREFYFGVDNDGIMEIHYATFEKGTWSKQKRLFESDSIGYNDPMFSPDENRLYFISNKPIANNSPKKDIDIWYVERGNKSEQWSEPINLGKPVNSELDEYYTSISNNGTIYFASKDKAKEAPRYAFDIYRSKSKNGKFQNPEKLPETINTNRYEADVFIAPDESYMIFCAIHKNGLGQGDLYISFQNEKGEWSQAENMGELINSDKHELCPYVSPNGKYFFYTSNKDIYWVSTDIIENYRK